MRKLSRLISVLRLITGIPVPKIHRRTLINRGNGTEEADGADGGAADEAGTG